MDGNADRQSQATRTVALADLPGRPCPMAATLELVGERWSLLVVRELWMGSHRFTDVVQGLGAPRDRVAARLRSLEAAGVVERRQVGEGSRHEYHLTAAGRDLAPVLLALLAWGSAHAVRADDPDLGYSERLLAALSDGPRPALATEPRVARHASATSGSRS